MSDAARRAWAGGDYAGIAEVLWPASEALVARAGIGPGDEVLDVAAGTGNLAIAAARAGARVTASDLTPSMIELGRARTEGEGLDVAWVEADAQSLPFPDAGFDCVTSVFGAIFAPDPERAAAELFRVARPGGRVALTSWIPEGWNGEFMRLMGEASGMPAGVALPPEWGIESIMRARLEPHAAQVVVGRLELDWEGDSLDGLLEFVEAAAPPWVAARAAVDDERYAELRGRLRDALERFGQERDGRFVAPTPYLLAVASLEGA